MRSLFIQLLLTLQFVSTAQARDIDLKGSLEQVNLACSVSFKYDFVLSSGPENSFITTTEYVSESDASYYHDFFADVINLHTTDIKISKGETWRIKKLKPFRRATYITTTDSTYIPRKVLSCDDDDRATCAVYELTLQREDGKTLKFQGFQHVYKPSRSGVFFSIMRRPLEYWYPKVPFSFNCP